MVGAAQGRLVRKAQPAYSPELNPHGRIWKWLRRVVTHHHWFVTLSHQIDAIRTFLRYLAGLKDQVRRLCGVKTPESLIASLWAIEQPGAEAPPRPTSAPDSLSHRSITAR
jgi:hypothetical protein